MALSGDQASSHQVIENEHPLTTVIAKELLALASKTQNALNASIHSAATAANDTLAAAESAVMSHFDNASSSFIAQIDEDSVVSEDDGSVLIIYVAIFVSLGGLVVAGLVSVLVWYWCRRSATREKRLLEGRCGMERAAMTEAQKKEALFKEIRRDIAAVENDGFLRHLEVYMLPQYADHPHNFQSNHPPSSYFHSRQGAHHVYDPYLPPNPPSHCRSSNRTSSSSSHQRQHHNKNSTGNVQVSNSSSMAKPSSKNHSQSFLVTSPLSSASSTSQITRSSTMTTTASSISSYSSSASSTLSHNRNHVAKRPQHDVLAPMISDNGEAAQAWGEEEDDDLVSDHH